MLIGLVTGEGEGEGGGEGKSHSKVGTRWVRQQSRIQIEIDDTSYGLITYYPAKPSSSRSDHGPEHLDISMGMLLSSQLDKHRLIL